MEGYTVSLSRDNIIFLCLLIWFGTMYAMFRWGLSRGKKGLCEYLNLRTGEDGKREWILVPVRMRGIKIDGDTSNSSPITSVLVNVRTMRACPPSREFRDITRGDYNYHGILPEVIVLGGPPYVPVNKNPGSVVMLGAEYRSEPAIGELWSQD